MTARPYRGQSSPAIRRPPSPLSRDSALYVIMLHGGAHPEYYVKRALLLDDAVYFTADNADGDHGWKRPKRMDWTTRDNP